MELIRVLHLEDVADDADLVRRTLAAAGLCCEITWAHDEKGFRAALDRPEIDLVLADNALPGLDGRAALRLSQERLPDVPFILVTGSLGEEYAVDMFQLGATDFVLKGRLGRLAPAVERALREAEERRSRRLAEARVREQAALLDLAPNAILVRDLDDRVRFWSKGAERTYGWPAEEAEGRDVRSLWPKLPEAAFAEAKAGALETGEWGGELTLATRDGRPLVVDSRWTRLRDEEGRPRSVLVIDTDVTEKKAIDAQLLRAQRLDSLGTLAGGIAHDLNNVLSPILLAVDLLKKKLSGDAKGLNTLANVEASARRGADLVRQILGFARGVQGERATLQPRKLIDDLEKFLAATFPKDIERRIDAGPDLWGVVGDATQLHQVLLNLCVNARDAMPGGGVLEIAAGNVTFDPSYARTHLDARAGPYVGVTVSDTGSGIPPGILDRIFEPFFTTKEEGQGTGLGLSTSLAIVKSHRGFISTDSEVGKGSAFTLYLPASPGSESSKAEEPSLEPAGGRGERVLVVDDEPAILEVTRETLEAGGYRVLTAGGGAEAVDLYAQHGRDVAAVITDLSMPGMSGYATIRALRTLDPQVRVITTSGLGEEGVAPPLVEGVRAFLRKPASAARMLATLRAVLDGQ